MFRNYLLTAWRNIRKNKLFSFINTVGLAIGLTCSLLIAMWLADELSYDRFHRQHAHIFRLNVAITFNGNLLSTEGTPMPLGPTLQQNYPAIRSFVRVSAPRKELIKYRDKRLFAENLLYVDSAFLAVFTFPVLHSKPAVSPLHRNGIVLTQQLAEKIFGTADQAVGQTLEFPEGKAYTVSAVIEDIPANSHLQFEALLPLPAFPGFTNEINSWGSFNTVTYLLLEEGFAIQQLQAKMKHFYRQVVAPAMGNNPNFSLSFSFQPLTAIHLGSTHLRGHEKGAKAIYLYALSGIALFILVIACINYINLATAQALKRAKEVGIRKVAGSSRSQLIRQHLVESWLITLLSLVISLTLVQVCLPLFNHIAGKNISVWSFLDGPSLIVLASIVLLTGFLSGSYPAFILSRYKPVEVLKGSLKSTPKGLWLRQGLVVFQFVISLMMVTLTVVGYQQLRYMKNNHLGFDQEQVLTVKMAGAALSPKAILLKNSLLKQAPVAGVTFARHAIGEHRPPTTQVLCKVKGQDLPVQTEFFGVEYDYLSVLGIQLKEGRNFNRRISTDGEAVLINETLARRLGVASALGTEVVAGEQRYRVIGVMKDFHVNSLHNSMEPLLLTLTPEQGEFVYVKANPNHLAKVKQVIAEAYAQLQTEYPLELGFLDQTFARQYAEDERKSTLFLVFCCITIVIACLGLFGLAAFSTEQRTKEIGVRKVMGASVEGILLLLTRDFVRLVLLAIGIALPLAFYGIREWLQGYAFRMDMSPWLFIIPAILVLFITLLTVSYQTLRAAQANPIKSLRTE